MTWCGRAFGVCAVLGVGLLPIGCSHKTSDVLPMSRNTPFVLQADEVESAVARTARSQQPEMPRPPSGVEPQAPPAEPPGLPAPPPSVQPPAGVKQVSLTQPADSRLSVSVRAWVNGKPIFDDEVRISLPGSVMRNIGKLPPDQQEAEVGRVLKLVIDGLIDQELLYQDAMRKLEKQPKFLEKIKTAANRDVQKRIRENMRQNNLNTVQEMEQALAQQGASLESIKRVMEREFIAMEYVKVRVGPAVQRIGHDDILEYYNQHLNEFQQPDRVKWQNIFIAVGPKHPTMADARTFAEQLMANWRAGADIAKLLEFDDGDSQFRKGDGAGELRGQIKPSELEASLFAMKDGEFGPLVELSTGVHLFRLIKREYAGVMPFDDKTQKMIDNKLKNDIFDRERRRLVRELRDQAADRVIIVTERPSGQ